MYNVDIEIIEKRPNSIKKQQKTIKQAKNCEFCDKGTMHLIRRSIKCFR